MNTVVSFNLANLLIGALLAALIAGIARRFRSLTISGAIATVLTGTIVFGAGQFLFAVPLIFFFVTSLLLSRLKSPRKSQASQYGQKEGARDLWQVFSNGGTAVICTIIYLITGEVIWFVAYLAAVAEATADTWATEIGMLSASRPFDLITLSKIDAGLSGGVTGLGTFASLAGAFLTALVGGVMYCTVSGNWEALLSMILVAGVSGFAGGLIDSFLGGSVQGQYRCPRCGKRTEKRRHCDYSTELTRGFSFVNNDVINFASTVAAAVTASVFSG